MSDPFQAAWETAAADAEVGDVEVVLYPLSANASYGAMHFPPGLSPHQWDTDFGYTAADRKRLEELRDQHVLVVDRALARRRRALVLRHEAEHVSQAETLPAASEFAQRLAVALPTEADWLYLAMPHERDADAATTRFRREREIEVSASDLEGPDRFLYDAPWAPPDPESLPLRLLAFSLFYPNDFDLACSTSQFWPSVDPEALIAEMIPGGVAARAKLRKELVGKLEEIADHGISQAAWDVMPRTERNAVSDELRTQVVEWETNMGVLLQTALAE
jgi:hypothetical protein